MVDYDAVNLWCCTSYDSSKAIQNYLIQEEIPTGSMTSPGEGGSGSRVVLSYCSFLLGAAFSVTAAVSERTLSILLLKTDTCCPVG